MGDSTVVTSESFFFFNKELFLLCLPFVYFLGSRHSSLSNSKVNSIFSFLSFNYQKNSTNFLISTSHRSRLRKLNSKHTGIIWKTYSSIFSHKIFRCLTKLHLSLIASWFGRWLYSCLWMVCEFWYFGLACSHRKWNNVLAVL